jgi:hypothetical protein
VILGKAAAYITHNSSSESLYLTKVVSNDLGLSVIGLEAAPT